MPIYTSVGANRTLKFLKDKKYAVQLWGGSGAGSGDNGGYAQAIIESAADLTLYLYVGGPGGTSFRYDLENRRVNDYRIGGWNGGGSGGTTVVDTKGCGDYGGGGGGATDLRTSNSTTVSTSLASRILVAGGGGGSGDYYSGGRPECSGTPTPPTPTTDGYREPGGGYGASQTAAGKGGEAGSCAADANRGVDSGNNFYFSGGGGGGGGWYGGGGGGGGFNILTSATSGTAGASGSSGNGGAGGNGAAKATSSGGGFAPGSGGGGSSYIKPGLTYLKNAVYESQMSGRYGIKFESDKAGLAEIYEIISKPKIVECFKEGNKAYVIIEKEQINNIEEKYFYEIDGSDADFGKGTPLILQGDRKILSFTLDYKTTGEKMFNFCISDCEGNIEKVALSYRVSTLAPVISYNTEVLQGILNQGDSIYNLFNVVTTYKGMSYRVETELYINNILYPHTFSLGVGQSTIQLPYIYDGYKNKEYTLKIRSRACQLAENIEGTGKDIWGEWIEYDGVVVQASSPVINNMEFNNRLTDLVIPKSSVMDISWQKMSKFFGRRGSLRNVEEYKLFLYSDDGALTDSWIVKGSQKRVIASYEPNKKYRFGVSLYINNWISNIVYTDYFYIADIETKDLITIDNNLNLITLFDFDYNRIEALSNDNIIITSKENLNEKLQLWDFKNGSNTLEIKIFMTPTHSINTKYNLTLNYDESSIEPIEKFEIVSKVSYNNDDKTQTTMLLQPKTMVDIGVAETESYADISTIDVIDTITYKTTFLKKEQEAFTIRLFELNGAIL